MGATGQGLRRGSRNETVRFAHASPHYTTGPAPPLAMPLTCTPPSYITGLAPPSKSGLAPPLVMPLDLHPFYYTTGLAYL